MLPVGGIPATVKSLGSGDPTSRATIPGVSAATFAVPAALGSGSFPLTISVNGVTGNTHLLPVASSGLSLSQTGVTFRAVTGSVTPLERSISVISTSQAITWNATSSTVSGGNWLFVSP